MRDQTRHTAPDGAMRDELHARSGDAAGQTTVPTTLLDAVMDVDAAIDDGGLELQEALARMHQELGQLIPGPSGRAAASSSAPVSPEQSTSRT